MPNNHRITMNVYKIMTSIDVVTQSLLEDDYHEVECIRDGYRLFVAGLSSTPKWKSFLNAIAQEARDYKNVSQSFVLMRVIGESTAFAVTGGRGTYAIQSFIDDNFGLEILARLIDPDKIKLIRNQAISGNVAQEEIVYKRVHSYHSDPLGWLKLPRQILGEIDKEDLATRLGLSRDDRRPIRLDGKRGFSIKRSISFDELDLLLTNLENVMASEPRIDLMMGCEEVTKKERQQLNKALDEHLNEMFNEFMGGSDDFDDQSVIFTSDDARQWVLCTEFGLMMGSKKEAKVETLGACPSKWV